MKESGHLRECLRSVCRFVSYLACDIPGRRKGDSRATLESAFMLLTARYLLLGLYAFIPAVGIGITIRRWRRAKSREALKALIGTGISSVLLGAVLAGIFAFATDSRIRSGQVALSAWYFAAILILLK